MERAVGERQGSEGADGALVCRHALSIETVKGLYRAAVYGERATESRDHRCDLSVPAADIKNDSSLDAAQRILEDRCLTPEEPFAGGSAKTGSVCVGRGEAIAEERIMIGNRGRAFSSHRLGHGWIVARPGRGPFVI